MFGLQLEVEGKPGFKLGGVDKGVRPFINMAFEGDSATLLACSEDSEPSAPSAEAEAAGGGESRGSTMSQEELERLRAEADEFWK